MIGSLLRTITGADKRAMLSGGAFDAMDWLIGSRSAAGVEVTPNGALASTTVMACVTLIARSLASVPLVLYRRTADGGREPAEEHPSILQSGYGRPRAHSGVGWR